MTNEIIQFSEQKLINITTGSGRANSMLRQYDTVDIILFFFLDYRSCTF